MSFNLIFQMPSIGLIIILIIAVLTDILKGKIPNWLTFPAILLGLIWISLLSGFVGFVYSFLGIIVGIGLFIPSYSLGGMGAGDVKLMGVVGAFLGPKNVIWACIFSCIIGGIYAIVVLYFSGMLKNYLKRYGLMLKTFFLTREFSYMPPLNDEKTPKLRFGLAIAIGTIALIYWRKIELVGA